MLLSKIFADPEKFQLRDGPFSTKLVDGIIAEGINLSKYDHLPVFPVGKRWCVGGDGHSRFEAIVRLAREGRLPAAWKRGKDWDVPHREVSVDVAEDLAWSANLSRDNFTPCEEARAYAKGIESLTTRHGFTEADAVAEVARRAHKSAGYVRNMLPLNELIPEIRERVGKHPDAGGVDKQIAQAIAEGCVKYNIDRRHQQELWQKVFAHADLTVNFVRGILKTMAPELQQKMSQGALFEIPSSVTGVVKEMKGRADGLRQLRRGLAWLMQCKRETTVMDGVEILVPLKRYLEEHGVTALQKVKTLEKEEAGLVGQIAIQPEQKPAKAKKGGRR